MVVAKLAIKVDIEKRSVMSQKFRFIKLWDLLQGCQKGFKQQADNEQQAGLELTPKVLVLEGRGIQGHFENQSLGNRISRGFQEVFLTTDATLFRQDTCKTGNNAIKMSLAFHNIAQFKRFTGLNLLEDAFNVIQNWETDALQFYLMVLNYFLLAVMVEGAESSRLRMANQLAVLAGYQPLLTALFVSIFRKNKMRKAPSPKISLLVQIGG